MLVSKRVSRATRSSNDAGKSKPYSEASDILWENLGVVGTNAVFRSTLAWLGMLIVLVCTGAAVVVAKSSANKVPPAIACQPVEDAGTLTCDAMWPAAATSGAASKAILRELDAFVSQVDAEVCRAYVASGSWKGNSAVYAPYVRPSAGLYDKATVGALPSPLQSFSTLPSPCE